MKQSLTKEQMDTLINKNVFNVDKDTASCWNYSFNATNYTNASSFVVMSNGKDISSELKRSPSSKYRSFNYFDIIELLPDCIYVDEKYDYKEGGKKLNLYMYKINSDNADIDYNYCIGYKMLNISTKRSRLGYKRYDARDPYIEGDEPIDIAYTLLLWCINHGHIKRPEPVRLEKVTSRGK